MSNFDKLLAEAKKLGIPINSAVYKPMSEAWTEIQISEYELQRRIKEEQRNQREHKLWIIAVISAVASIISAIAAWAAVYAQQ